MLLQRSSAPPTYMGIARNLAGDSTAQQPHTAACDNSWALITSDVAQTALSHCRRPKSSHSRSLVPVAVARGGVRELSYSLPTNTIKKPAPLVSYMRKLLKSAAAQEIVLVLSKFLRPISQVILREAGVSMSEKPLGQAGTMPDLQSSNNDMELNPSGAGMELTELLQRLQDGDSEVMQIVMPLVYQELKKLASANLRRQSKSRGLDTTALVHEAFLKLARGRHPAYENRTHFYGIASRVMRQVLVDTARAMGAEKRGAGQEVALADLPDRAPQPNRSLLAVDEALNRLEQIDPLKANVIDLRYFGGMTAEESSLVLSIPVHRVRRELRLAQAWLRKEIAGQISQAVGFPSDASWPDPA